MADNLRLPHSNMIIVDTNGDPVSGAKLEIFDAGTTNQKNVFTDATLLTAADNPIIANGNGGIPVRYIGTGDYKVTYKDSADVTLANYATEDDVPGAIDTSGFLTGTISPSRAVISKTTNYTTVADDDGKQINADATGGSFTVTMRSAVAMGDGGDIVVKHSGTANEVTVAATQNIDTKTSYILQAGDAVTIRSDGANFSVVEAFNYTDGIVTTTYASTIALDFSFPTGTDHQITLTGALTLNAPTNVRIGQRGTFTLIQDATGGHVTTFNAVFKGDPNIDTTALTANKLNFHVRSLTEIDLWPSQPPAQIPTRTLIETIEPVSGTEVLFDAIADTYFRLQVEAENINIDTGLWQLVCEVSDDNGSTFNTVEGHVHGSNNGTQDFSGNTVGDLFLTTVALGAVAKMEIFFPMYNSTVEEKMFHGITSFKDSGNVDTNRILYMTTDSAGAIDAVRFRIIQTTSEEFVTGTFRLYGWN